MESGRGVVLYGPPGNGKTLIVRAIATELRWFLQLINGPDIMSMLVGEGPRVMREKFKEAVRNKPSIFAIDEADVLFPVRGASLGQEYKTDYLAQFNVLMEGMEEMRGVFVFLLTNRIDKMDPAAIRAGRINKKIFIPRPNMAAAQAILRIHFSRHPVSGARNEEEKLRLIDGWSKKITEAIFAKSKLTPLFTAFRGEEPETKYYFEHFVSGALLKNIVRDIAIRALERMKREGVKPEDPSFGIAEEDLDGAVFKAVVSEIPQDDSSRKEWLMVNGYPRADEFRDGDAILKFKQKELS